MVVDLWKTFLLHLGTFVACLDITPRRSDKKKKVENFPEFRSRNLPGRVTGSEWVTGSPGMSPHVV